MKRSVLAVGIAISVAVAAASALHWREQAAAPMGVGYLDVRLDAGAEVMPLVVRRMVKALGYPRDGVAQRGTYSPGAPQCGYAPPDTVCRGCVTAPTRAHAHPTQRGRWLYRLDPEERAWLAARRAQCATGSSTDECTRLLRLSAPTDAPPADWIDGGTPTWSGGAEPQPPDAYDGGVP